MTEPDHRGLDRLHNWEAIRSARRKETIILRIAIAIIITGIIAMTIYFGGG